MYNKDDSPSRDAARSARKNVFQTRPLWETPKERSVDATGASTNDNASGDLRHLLGQMKQDMEKQKAEIERQKQEIQRLNEELLKGDSNTVVVTKSLMSGTPPLESKA